VIMVDHQIAEAVNKGEIEISDFSLECLGPASYDLRVGKEGYTTSAGRIIDLEAEGALVIQPGDLALVVTYERLGLPTNVVGRFGLRSKYARMGLLLTAGPQIDPGFRGKLVFGIVNFSSQSVSLRYLEPFCTLELNKLPVHSSKPYEGPYQGQENISDEVMGQLPQEPLPLATMLIRQLVAASPSLSHVVVPSQHVPRTPRSETFEREKRAFQRLKPLLMKSHRGEYVVIRDGKAVLFGRNKVELARKAYGKFGYGPLYIGLVQEEPEVIHMPTPTISRETP